MRKIDFSFTICVFLGVLVKFTLRWLKIEEDKKPCCSEVAERTSEARAQLAFVNVSRQDIFLADETWDILHQQKQDRQVFCVLTGEACDVPTP